MRILLMCSVLCASTVHAQSAPVTQEEWTPETRLWLARAMIAEGGWEATRDHAAIAWVLYKRWRLYRPAEPFHEYIRAYCQGLDPKLPIRTNRQRWLRALSGDTQPAHWPVHEASWAAHRQLWREALRRADDWALGRLADPCKGKAWHWGGDMDSPNPTWSVVQCGFTENTFYRPAGLASVN